MTEEELEKTTNEAVEKTTELNIEVDNLLKDKDLDKETSNGKGVEE